MPKIVLFVIFSMTLALAAGCGRDKADTPDVTASLDSATSSPTTSQGASEATSAQPNQPNGEHATTPDEGFVASASPAATAIPPDPAFCDEKSPDPIVALVAGKIRIPFSQVHAMTVDEERRLVDVPNTPDGFDRARIINDHRLKTLDRIVQQQRQLLEAMRRNIEPTPEETQQQLAQLVSNAIARDVQALERRLRSGEITEEERDRQREQLTENAVNDMMAQTGWTREEFDEQVKKFAMVSKMMTEQVYNNILPTTEEMQHFYDSNKTTFCMTPARADIHRVEMHANEKRTLEQTRQEIEKVRDEVAKAVADASPQEKIRRFVDYIRKHSDGPDALGGGYVIIYGTEPRGTLEEPTINMAYASEPYTLSPVFEIYNGYSFLMLMQIYPRTLRTFKELKSSIHSELLDRKQKARTQEFVDEVTARYPVEICRKNLYVATEPKTATGAEHDN